MLFVHFEDFIDNWVTRFFQTKPVANQVESFVLKTKVITKRHLECFSFFVFQMRAQVSSFRTAMILLLGMTLTLSITKHSANKVRFA